MFPLQTHPNIDKKLFGSSSVIGLKNPDKPFPLNQDIGVLKWRFQTQDESFMPLSSECQMLSVIQQENALNFISV